jgi:hypothetical protein
MVKVYPTITKTNSTLVHFETPLDDTAPQKGNSTDVITVLQFKNLFTWGGLQMIDEAVTSRCYHTARKQGAFIGRASYKHHAYMMLGYLAQSIN